MEGRNRDRLRIGVTTAVAIVIARSIVDRLSIGRTLGWFVGLAIVSLIVLAAEPIATYVARRKR